MTIDLRMGDLFEQPADAIVHPTNSLCRPATTLSITLHERAGEAMERELNDVAPFAVGAATVTTGGKLIQKFVIHVPVLDEPGQRVHAENVRRATRAALLAALKIGVDTLVMPGLVTEKAGVSPDVVARAMHDEIRAHKQPKPQSVVICDLDPVMVENFRIVLGSR